MSVLSNPSTKRRRFLAVGLAAAAGWAFYCAQISPIRERERTIQHRIAELGAEVERASQAIVEIRALEVRAAEARAELDRGRQERPAASAVIWLPELVKGHFARFGVAATMVRLNTTREEPEAPDYQRGYWSVSLPIDETARSVTGLLLAMAQLEQQHAFVKVLDFAIQPDPEDPGRRIGALNVSALILK